MPRSEEGDGWILWRLERLEACGSLTRFEQSEAYGGVADEEWTEFRCRDGEPWVSYLEVYLSD